MLQNKYINYKDKSSENYAGKTNSKTLHTGWYSYIMFQKWQNYRNAEQGFGFSRVSGWGGGMSGMCL